MLTLQQKIQDLDYFWHILDTCFPVKGPATRVGLDWEAAREASYKAVKESKDDLEFFRAIRDIPKMFREKDRGTFCHLAVYVPPYYHNSRKSFTDLLNGGWNGADSKWIQPWVDPLMTKEGEAFYAQFDPDHWDVYYKGEAPEGNGRPGRRRLGKMPNVDCRILVDKKVAYICIRSLDTYSINSDREIIVPFLEQVKDYPHLIIDVRRNGGGNTDYWQKMLVPMLIKEPHSVKAFMAIKICDENRQYLGQYDGRMEPIADLPELPGMVKEDLADLTHFTRSNYEVLPDEKNHLFDGKVWMLTSANVYSSCEAFAMFSKFSGFATLIGGRTGGDGISIMSFHYAMPNSGIVWRFKGVYGINPDGTSNQVCATTPHIECEPNEALGRCLMEIEKYEEENK